MIPVCTCTCHNRTFQTKTHPLDGVLRWQLTRTIIGHLIWFLSSPLKSRLECFYLAGLGQCALRWNSYKHFDLKHVCNRSPPPHLSTMLGSALLDSRSSTQRAVWSSVADAVQLAMSTVQWSVDPKVTFHYAYWRGKVSRLLDDILIFGLCGASPL